MPGAPPVPLTPLPAPISRQPGIGPDAGQIGLPVSVRGAGARRFGLPSAVRGTLRVGYDGHCAESGIEMSAASANAHELTRVMRDGL